MIIRHIFKHDLDYLDKEIKLFLSDVRTVQESLILEGDARYLKREKTYWLSRYNYLCILNLSVRIKRYGPLIDLWEDSNPGEGYLRYTKSRILKIGRFTYVHSC